MLYIACPYWHEDEAIRNWRVEVASYYTMKLWEVGRAAFSPISHSAIIKKHGTLTHEQWVDLDMSFLRLCSCVHVLKLPGWDKSIGVQLEVEEAERLDIPIVYRTVSVPGLDFP